MLPSLSPSDDLESHTTRRKVQLDEFGLSDDNERFFNEDVEADITTLDYNAEQAVSIVTKATGGRLLYKEFTEDRVKLGFTRRKPYDEAKLLERLKTVDPGVGMSYDEKSQLLLVFLDTHSIAVYKLSWREMLVNKATLWLSCYLAGVALLFSI